MSPIYFIILDGGSITNYLGRRQIVVDEADFAGYSQGMVRLYPIQLVAPLLRFTLSLPAIGVAKKLILTKFKKKEND